MTVSYLEWLSKISNNGVSHSLSATAEPLVLFYFFLLMFCFDLEWWTKLAAHSF